MQIKSPIALYLFLFLAILGWSIYAVSACVRIWAPQILFQVAKINILTPNSYSLTFEWEAFMKCYAGGLNDRGID